MNYFIIGDIILDRYIFVTPVKVSEEAPVLVTRMVQEEYRLGGAANVANNLASFNVTPQLCGSISKDNDAIFSALTKDVGIKTKYVHFSNNNSACIKTRIVCDNQQIVRFDTPEGGIGPSKQILDTLLQGLRRNDVVILSDYNKGTLTNIAEIISFCNEHNIPTFVDPKSTNFKKYKGATLLKPNEREFEQVYGQALGDADLIAKIKHARADLKLQYLLVTRGKKGMVLCDNNDNIYQSKVPHVSVVDVTGAGDTVLAAISYFLTNEVELQEALNLCVDIAQIVVTKQGTSFVTSADTKGKLKDYITRK